MDDTTRVKHLDALPSDAVVSARSEPSRRLVSCHRPLLDDDVSSVDRQGDTHTCRGWITRYNVAREMPKIVQISSTV